MVAVLACACTGDDGDAPAAEDASTSGPATTGDASTSSGPADESSSSGTVAPPTGCEGFGTPGATANCLRPTMPPEYYVAEAEAYFDTLDVDAPRDSVPNYHPQVARWEWPPWLLLTGYGAMAMINTADSLRKLDPSTVPVRDCRFFEVQPFARCYVEFEYENGPCPIYEEFTFNDAGEMTFIEAWSDLPDFLPQNATDAWAEAPDYPRLANKVPGLGTPSGTIDLDSPEMAAAVEADPDVADFAWRAEDWWAAWFEELKDADPEFFAIGCGWPAR
ncbi:MAG: hypothetical protein AAGA54_00470 [Myxococcota bacterium]